MIVNFLNLSKISNLAGNRKSIVLLVLSITFYPLLYSENEDITIEISFWGSITHCTVKIQAPVNILPFQGILSSAISSSNISVIFFMFLCSGISPPSWFCVSLWTKKRSEENYFLISIMKKSENTLKNSLRKVNKGSRWSVRIWFSTVKGIQEFTPCFLSKGNKDHCTHLPSCN